ncbi:RNA-binding protein [Leptolyngbya valderiana BDU 20041]|nr:NYN domain-containing protein [Geitlerinema sp. CS-897]OAB62364.1 RNA-binding protein [Leptolyngbya valderiana BDU 20041]PPT11015.1 C-terminal domain of ribosome protection-type Tc-resistance protein [Geitlerinema sp. FC II]
MSPTSPFVTLFVDGYNIIGIWAQLRQIRNRDGLEPARRTLVEALVNYSAYKGFETCIVFDSQYRNSRGHRETVSGNLCIHYTDFDQTADTFIEKNCAVRQRQVHPLGHRTIVATSDRAQQLTVVGYGAEWMSAEQLDREVRATTQRVRQRQRTSTTRSSRRFLSSRLDPVAQQRLSQLRRGF